MDTEITTTPEQQAVNRERWIQALRSGQYTQTTGMLHTDQGYCCLGVACAILADELNLEVRGIQADPDDSRGYDYYQYDHNQAALPDAVLDALGLRESTGSYGLAAAGHSLADANDTLKLSFEAIADIIEYAPEGLLA